MIYVSEPEVKTARESLKSTLAKLSTKTQVKRATMGTMNTNDKEKKSKLPTIKNKWSSGARQEEGIEQGEGGARPKLTKLNISKKAEKLHKNTLKNSTTKAVKTFKNTSMTQEGEIDTTAEDNKRFMSSLSLDTLSTINSSPTLRSVSSDLSVDSLIRGEQFENGSLLLSVNSIEDANNITLISDDTEHGEDDELLLLPSNIECSSKFKILEKR